MSNLNRRDFLKHTISITAGLCFAGIGLKGCKYYEQEIKESHEEDVNDKEKMNAKNEMPKRKLGKTNIEVSLLGLGGAMTLAHQVQKSEAVKIINKAIDLGVNYIDTAPTYGASEANIGEVMRDRRSEVFLATKTIERSYDSTLRLFENSLQRLQVNGVDLYQVHGIHEERDLELISKPNGALKALEELKKEGVVNYIGITGHRDPNLIIKAIKNYDFDCILIPLNAADKYYAPFQKELLDLAVQKNIGVIAMKVAAYGRIFKDEGIKSMKEAMGYTLSFPVSTAVVGISDVKQLEENVKIAKEFKPYSQNQLTKLEELVAPYQEEVNFFKRDW